MRLPDSIARSLAEALRGPLHDAETGTLYVHARADTHRIYVRGGYVAQVELAGGQEPLGMVLAESGLLSLTEVRQSLRRRPDDLYGVSLVRDSFLTADSVLRGLRAQMARRAARILLLEEARFRFEPGAIPVHALATPSTRLHPLELLWLAARHPTAAQRSLSRTLPLKTRRLRLTVEARELGALPALRESLSEAEWQAVEALAAGSRFGELITSGVVPAALGSALVESLLLSGLLEVEADDSTFRIDPMASRAARARSAHASPSSSPRPRPEAEGRDAIVAEVRWLVRRCADAWRLLGVAPGDSPEKVRAAYRARALALHPDRWSDGAPPADLSQLFAAVSDAYRGLAPQLAVA